MPRACPPDNPLVRPPIRSEDEFLALVDRYFPQASPGSPRVPGVATGRGDDAAVLDLQGQVCLTTDLFLEDIHFRRSYFTPADIGYKGLAVNLSDVAAMGARPLGFALDLMVPPNLDADFLEAMLAAMAELAARTNTLLVGGDLSRAPFLGLAITAWGQAAPGGRFLGRGEVNPGDVVFAVGPLGLARAGLTLLEDKGLAAAASHPRAKAAHLRPTPRLEAGQALARLQGVTGLMDVSDGLARDLPRLLGAGLGADIRLDAAALDPEVRDVAERAGQPAELWAFVGGEDYALLGACRESDQDQLAHIPGLQVIGRVREAQAGPRLMLNGQPADAAGFDHFQDPSATDHKG